MLNHEKLRELILDAGLSHLVDDMMNATRPSIHIIRNRVADESTLELGISKLGGSPDMPPGFIWPEWKDKPLTFIAQIRLSDTAPYDVERVLPSGGRLYFFYEADEQPWGMKPEEGGSFKVLYVKDEHTPLERFPHPIARGYYRQIQAFHPCVVTFSPEVTFAPEFFESLSLEDVNRLGNVKAVIYKTLQPMHHLLGHSEPLQGSMELKCHLMTHGLSIGDPVAHQDPRHFELEQSASDWRLLLQIDTDDGGDGFGPMWGDVGRIYYWIRKQDLEARTFDNCWLILQCT